MNDVPSGPFSPITKNFDISQALWLARLAWQRPNLREFKAAAVEGLPQATRKTRQEIVKRLVGYFFQVENGQIVRTPALQVWALPGADEQIARQLLYVYYLHATPLAWHAVRELVLPRSENPRADDAARAIPPPEWNAFLTRYLRSYTANTFTRTRNHLTAQLSKFGLLEAEQTPGAGIARRFYANPFRPRVEAFWFALALEYRDHAWTSRAVEFLAEKSWTRIAFCAQPQYARWALDEAERAGLGYMDYSGSDRQFTWRAGDAPAALARRIAGQAERQP